jgi:hypothetical protein
LRGIFQASVPQLLVGRLSGASADKTILAAVRLTPLADSTYQIHSQPRLLPAGSLLGMLSLTPGANTMSVEPISVLIAVVAVGVTLAGLMLTGQRAIRAELVDQRKEFGERFSALEQQITELRERMAHLDGLLDGLREAIAIPRGAA